VIRQGAIFRLRGNADALEGIGGNHKTAAIYDLFPRAAEVRPDAPGEWNQARVVVDGKRIQHWLNGIKVLEIDSSTPAFQRTGGAKQVQEAPRSRAASEGADPPPGSRRPRQLSDDEGAASASAFVTVAPPQPERRTAPFSPARQTNAYLAACAVSGDGPG
jgi:hypothetical protein